MQCPNCGIENRKGAKFCNECASALPLNCPSCGTENPPGAKFCNECAASLKERTKVSDTIKKEDTGTRSDPVVTTRDVPEAERRQLTVMFCDLVGSSALSEKLDPEDLRQVMKVYQEACAEVITRFDGHIAKYLGDGLLVYFGYPMAHEDDAQRAVRAGLEMVEAIHELPLQNKQIQENLQVRIGIHTGLVIVGEMGGGDAHEPMAIVGDTPNISARLQELASTNSVVVSSVTYQLIQGFFNCELLGSYTLKGFSQPMELYHVIKETGVQSRFEVAATKGLTPLVGREQEIGILLERWERVKDGEGQVVLLSGEAGIGKTRLLQLSIVKRKSRRRFTCKD